MRDPFDTTDYLKLDTVLGELVMFNPLDHIDEYETSFGTKDAIVADVVVFNADGTVTEYFAQTLLQGAIIGTLKRRLPVYNKSTGKLVSEGRLVLGRIGKGEGKKGQQAPYIITSDNLTEADKDRARAYSAENPRPADPAVDPKWVEPQPVVTQVVPLHQSPQAAVPSPQAAVVSPPVVVDSYSDPFASAPAAAPGEDPFAV